MKKYGIFLHCCFFFGGKKRTVTFAASLQHILSCFISIQLWRLVAGTERSVRWGWVGMVGWIFWDEHVNIIIVMCNNDKN